MKKLFIIISCLLILNINTFVISAEDDNGIYVPSIGYKHDVCIRDDNIVGGTVVNTDNNSTVYRVEDDGCDVTIVLTPYARKDSIGDAETKSELEIAYNEILNAESVCTMAPALTNVIKGKGLVDEDLVVANIFNISTSSQDNGTHEDAYDHSRIYSLKVSAETLKNFVALLHYTYDPVSQTGVWEVVKDTRIVGDAKDTVVVAWPNASPFAIVSYKDGAMKKKGSADGYSVVNTSTTGNTNTETNTHKCIVCIGNTCYCFVVVILLILSVFLNVFLILKRNEKR